MNNDTKDNELTEKRTAADKAATKIAAMLLADLDIEVTAYQVERFIKMRWDKMAPLAHIVHEAPDRTKMPSV